MFYKSQPAIRVEDNKSISDEKMTILKKDMVRAPEFWYRFANLPANQKFYLIVEDPASKKEEELIFLTDELAAEFFYFWVKKYRTYLADKRYQGKGIRKKIANIETLTRLLKKTEGKVYICTDKTAHQKNHFIDIIVREGLTALVPTVKTAYKTLSVEHKSIYLDLWSERYWGDQSEPVDEADNMSALEYLLLSEKVSQYSKPDQDALWSLFENTVPNPADQEKLLKKVFEEKDWSFNNNWVSQKLLNYPSFYNIFLIALNENLSRFDSLTEEEKVKVDAITRKSLVNKVFKKIVLENEGLLFLKFLFKLASKDSENQALDLLFETNKVDVIPEEQESLLDLFLNFSKPQKIETIVNAKIMDGFDVFHSYLIEKLIQIPGVAENILMLLKAQFDSWDELSEGDRNDLIDKVNRIMDYPQLKEALWHAPAAYGLRYPIMDHQAEVSDELYQYALPPVFSSILKKDIESLEAVIKRQTESGGSPNYMLYQTISTKDDKGETDKQCPLHFAVTMNFKPGVVRLIREMNKAEEAESENRGYQDIPFGDAILKKSRILYTSQKETPWLLAARLGHWDIFEIFMNQWVCLDIPDNHQKTMVTYLIQDETLEAKKKATLLERLFSHLGAAKASLSKESQKPLIDFFENNYGLFSKEFKEKWAFFAGKEKKTYHFSEKKRILNLILTALFLMTIVLPILTYIYHNFFGSFIQNLKFQKRMERFELKNRGLMDRDGVSDIEASIPLHYELFNSSWLARYAYFELGLKGAVKTYYYAVAESKHADPTDSTNPTDSATPLKP